jgi:uncharacterized protein YjbJ (UPF0337 family)
VNKDRIIRAAKESESSAKATVGEAMGDARLLAEGRLGRTRRKIRQTVGVIEELKDARSE